MRRVQLLAGFAGALVLLSSGCADDGTAEVSGTILIDGAVPPENTQITFTPVDGVKSPAGTVVPDGKYSVRVAVGMAKVSVNSARAGGERKQRGPTSQNLVSILDAKYNTKTELTFDVKPGKQEHNLDLKGNGK